MKGPIQTILLNLLLFVAILLLAFGLWAPLLSLEKFYFFSNEVSLLSALEELQVQREWGLYVLIGVFSVVFPVFKLLILLSILNLENPDSRTHRKHLHWLNLYSKWSMLDVFVVALLVVTVKLGAYAQVRVGIGVYAFAASVILTMLISAYMAKARN